MSILTKNLRKEIKNMTEYRILDICKMCEEAELVNDEKVCASCNHPD